MPREASQGLLFYRTVMKTQNQREIKHTGGRGWIQCRARSEREMDILRVGSQAGGGTEVKELGSPAEREKQGGNQTACSDGRTQVGEGRNE